MQFTCCIFLDAVVSYCLFCAGEKSTVIYSRTETIFIIIIDHCLKFFFSYIFCCEASNAYCMLVGVTLSV